MSIERSIIVLQGGDRDAQEAAIYPIVGDASAC
jgi:hypothetical protein